MTDKQIIIDDIDVKQCKYFNSYQKIVRNNECIVDIQNACVEEIKTKPCGQKHNCYFKNWQRKEQECEELKAELELFKTSNQTTIDQLKGENDALFKAIEEVNKINKRLESINEELTSKCSQQEEEIKDLTAKNNEYIDKNHELVVQTKILKSNRLNMFEHLDIVQENNQLKQTLAEIKEICKTNVCKHCYSKFKVDDNYCKSRKNCDCYNILQKINEVEDAKSNN